MKSVNREDNPKLPPTTRLKKKLAKDNIWVVWYTNCVDSFELGHDNVDVFILESFGESYVLHDRKFSFKSWPIHLVELDHYSWTMYQGFMTDPMQPKLLVTQIWDSIILCKNKEGKDHKDCKRRFMTMQFKM